MAKSLILIAGATATGKTDFAIRLARELGTEIISADSRQVYKEMYIGTAVPDTRQLAAARHHLIGHVSIHQPYSAGIYAEEARQCISLIHETHDTAILCGGSGLYIDAVLDGLDSMPPVKPEIRQQLQQTLDKEGIEKLQEQLKQFDPGYASEVDLNNPRRLIRALEIILSSGVPYSSLRKGTQPSSDNFIVHRFCLTHPREILHQRINERVERMMDSGLLKEAESLYPCRDLSALQTVGYQELFSFIDGKISLDQAIADIKTNTRRYAKRQETWFRRMKDCQWIDAGKPEECLEKVRKGLDLAGN